MPLSASQLARLIAPLGPQTARQSGVRSRVLWIQPPTSNVTHTIRNVGFTPKGVICFGASNTTGQTPIAPSGPGLAIYGASDGTNQFSCSNSTVEGSSSTAQGQMLASICLGYSTAGGLTQNRAAASGFSSADGGSFTLTWYGTAGGSLRYMVLVLGGDDLEFRCGLTNLGTATGSLVMTSGLSFQPDLVGMMITHLQTTAGGGTSSSITAPARDLHGSIGWATAADAFSMAMWHDTGTADSVSYRAARESLFTVIDSAEKIRCSLASLDANGFTITRDVNDGLFDTVCGWVAIKAPGIALEVRDTSTTPGVETVAVPGIVPRALMVLGASTLDTSSIATECIQTIGATDGTTRLSQSTCMEHGRPTVRVRNRGDLGHLHRPQLTIGDNLWQTGPAIKNARFAPEQIALDWSRITTPQIRVIQSVTATSVTSATLAATTAGSTLIVAIGHASVAVSSPWAPSDPSNGAYTAAVEVGTTSLGSRVFYKHNSVAGVTTVNFNYTGSPVHTTRVIEVVGLDPTVPLTRAFSDTATTAFIWDLVAGAPSPLATTREAYLVAPLVVNSTVSTSSQGIPGFAVSVASAVVYSNGITPDGMVDGRLQAGVAQALKLLSAAGVAVFEAPAITPRKVAYLVIGEAAEEPPAGDLSVSVSDDVTLTESASTAATGGPAPTTDALQRRSMTSLGLFHLRGGVIPTGANLETPRERMYAEGLYARKAAAVAPTALTVEVGDSVTVTDSTVAGVSPSTIAVADSVTITDAVAAGAGLLSVGLSETVAVTDAIAAFVSPAIISLSDSVTVTESAKPAVQLGIVVSDSSTITDATQAAVSPTTVSVFDAVTLTESAKPAIQLGLVLADSVTVTESAKPALQLAVAVSDGSTVTDAVQAAVSPLTRASSDTVAVTDSTKVALDLGIAVSDSSTVTDATLVTGSPGLTSVSDAVTVSEVSKAAIDLGVRPVESVTVTDALVLVANPSRISVSDTVTVLDEAFNVGPATSVRVETVTITDAVQAALSPVVVRVSDLTTVTDDAHAGLSPTAVSLSDSVTVNETVAVLAPTYAVHATDSVAVTEFAKAVLPTLSVSVSDSTTIDDAAYGIGPLTALVADAVAVTEYAKAILPVLVVQRVETIGVSDDAHVGLSPIVVRASDSSTVTEAAQAAVTPQVARPVEIIAVTDAATVRLDTLAVHAADTVTVTDSASTDTITVLGGRSVSETIAVSDETKAVLSPLIARPTETIAVADETIAAVTPVVQTAAEAVVVADVASVTMVTVRLYVSVADATTITDTTAAALQLGFALVDATVVAEQVDVDLRTVRITASVGDIVLVTDEALVAGTAVGVRIESVTVTDEATAVLVSTRLYVEVADDVEVDDATSIDCFAVLITVSLADAVSVSDTAAGRRTGVGVYTAIKVVDDTLTYANAVRESLTPITGTWATMTAGRGRGSLSPVDAMDEGLVAADAKDEVLT